MPPSAWAEPAGLRRGRAPARSVPSETVTRRPSLRSASGPWPGDPPDDPRYDPELLAEGDRRNVVDRYRYWRHEAIVADLDRRRHDFHVAIENWQHDLNIGTVVRNANAFLAAEVHIVGRRRWNRRGAMVTDRYQHVRHHETIEEFVAWAGRAALPVVGIDNLPGSRPLETGTLPRRCVLLFGQEGPGLSDAGPGRLRPALLDRPVRLDPVDQRGRGQRHRHARLDPCARRHRRRTDPRTVPNRTFRLDVPARPGRP